jgi:hypothetical protein
MITQRILLIGATALVAASGVASAAFDQLGLGDLSASSSRSHRPELTIGGQVSGLTPARQRLLRLNVHNGHERGILLRRVRVIARDASADCSADNMRIDNDAGEARSSQDGTTVFLGHKRIRAGGDVRVQTEVSMRRQAPDACQGAMFPMRYWATAKTG